MKRALRSICFEPNFKQKQLPDESNEAAAVNLKVMDPVKPVFIVKAFEELSSQELYDVLKLRSEVFHMEQQALYLDIDAKDQKALHVVSMKKGTLIAYARIFDRDAYFETASIGRVVVAKKERNQNYGHALVDFAIASIEKHFGQTTVRISAQRHLQKFYEFHRFVAFGPVYLEDGIPHIGMLRSDK